MTLHCFWLLPNGRSKLDNVVTATLKVQCNRRPLPFSIWPAAGRRLGHKICKQFSIKNQFYASTAAKCKMAKMPNMAKTKVAHELRKYQAKLIAPTHAQLSAALSLISANIVIKIEDN